MVNGRTTQLALALTPQGDLLLTQTNDVVALPEDMTARLRAAFERGHGHGLLQLGAGEVGSVLPPQISYWRGFAVRYVTAVCGQPQAAEGKTHSEIPPLSADVLESVAHAAPPMTGAEYLTGDVLNGLWRSMDTAFATERAASRLSVQDFLATKSPVWHTVGRVHFNLAENRLDTEAPFAFLATYTTQLTDHARPQHLPLGQARRSCPESALALPGESGRDHRRKVGLARRRLTQLAQHRVDGLE